MTEVLRLLLTFLDLTGLTLLGLSFVQMLLAALSPRVRRARPVNPGPLHFTFVIPALNEGAVIGATVSSLRALAPEARVVVIDDGSEDDTAAVVLALAGQDTGVQLLRRFPPQARQGKGQALNWAARRVLEPLRAAGRDLTHEILVVVDADGRLTPELLAEARAALVDVRVVGAQCRVCIRPSVRGLSPRRLIGRVLEQQQDLEFFVIRHLQRLRHRWHTVGLCGNGQFMRASYLHAQFERGEPAWPDCLSEDFASGLEMRLAAPTHRMAFLEAAVTQQGLPNLRRFVRQRARWAQGTMQCLGYLPRLWSAPVPWRARVDMSYYLLGPWLNAVIVLCLLSQPLRWVLGVYGLVLSPALSVLIAVLSGGLQLHWVARYQRDRRLGAGQLLFTVLSQPFYGLALSLSLPLAYWNHFSGRRTWDKTSRHSEAGEVVATTGD